MDRLIVLALVFAPAACDLPTVDPDKAAAWATAKAGRLLECQVIDAQTERERRDCLGEFASDLGSSACGAAAQWIESGVRP